MLNLLRLDYKNNKLKNIIEKVNIFKIHLKDTFPDGLVPFFEIQYFIETESENDGDFSKYSKIIEDHIYNYINSVYDDTMLFNINTLLFYENNLNSRNINLENDNTNNLSDLIEKPSFLNSNIIEKNENIN